MISGPLKDSLRCVSPDGFSISRPLCKDINLIGWPAGAAGLWTNRLTADGKLMDLSGNGTHLPITGATFRDGPWGKCLYFDGTDDHLYTGGFVTSETVGFTFATLVQPMNAELNTSGTKPAVLHVGTAGSGWIFFANYVLYWQRSGDPYDAVSINSAVSNYQSYLIVFRASGTLKRVYCRGIGAEKTNFNANKSFNDGNALYFARGSGGVNRLKGNIHFLGIWNRYISDAEIDSIYNQLLGVW